MGAKDHKKHSMEDISFALVTVSDTRTEKNDLSGTIIIELIEKAGHRVVDYGIIKDDMEMITAEGERLLSSEEVQAVIFTGGTGIARRDVTVEAVRPLMERELPGFGEIFRVLSMEEIGSAAMLSRATAGICNGKAVFCIPGSKGAVKLALQRLILEECGHILWEAGR
ncbi:MAG: molybdenum cofactor biosynthesis protein B [Candidatus Thermoplasmatota archaeon]|jgi:molybdenum cofactor biosynthesis protein B|nr:molybdenum cofactor biosynthesis protein B [Candidatus Thermoplasmatota archaeon]MDP7265944.1 molybdenum cofactor biosynthesis protein B [Candidatus Thermoplasmatota archaeon]